MQFHSQKEFPSRAFIVPDLLFFALVVLKCKQRYEFGGQFTILPVSFLTLAADVQVIRKLRPLTLTERVGSSTRNEFPEFVMIVDTFDSLHRSLPAPKLLDKSAFPQPFQTPVEMMANISE